MVKFYFDFAYWTVSPGFSSWHRSGDDTNFLEYAIVKFETFYISSKSLRWIFRNEFILHLIFGRNPPSKKPSTKMTVTGFWKYRDSLYVLKHLCFLCINLHISLSLCPPKTPPVWFVVHFKGQQRHDFQLTLWNRHLIGWFSDSGNFIGPHLPNMN